jgi:oxygen-independent coproporphyrinogen-3 oxidase
MPGIYIHIPFCKKACHYCNFHFSTSLQYKDAFIKALLAEIILRKNYLNSADGSTPIITSIYFGGGTPSLLSFDEMQLIFETLQQHFVIDASAEITMECNPDDLTPTKIEELKRTPVNRLSIGVQSFFNDDLQLMNRAHNSGQAHESIALAATAGFENITIDLMYALPTLTDAKWIKNLEIAFALPINHISCYNLTVEEQTALAHLIKTGTVPAIDENRAINQFELLQSMAAQHGFEHYEISNFAKPGKYSKHNSSYWKGNSYVGFGPSAHSFNGTSRQWNIANNQQYNTALLKGETIFEKENLSIDTQYNEYVMTTLRTMWGADLNYINTNFGAVYTIHFTTNVLSFLNAGDVIKTENTYTLSVKGKLIADAIAAQLFKVE